MGTDDKKKLLQITMMRWADNNSVQRGNRNEIPKHLDSDNEWKDDLTLVLKNSESPLTKNKKRVLNKIWNIYK